MHVMISLNKMMLIGLLLFVATGASQAQTVTVLRSTVIPSMKFS